MPARGSETVRVRGVELPDRNRGIALVVVLWAVVLLMTIGASFAFGVRMDTRMVANLGDAARSEALAEAGVYRGIVALLAPTGESGIGEAGRIADLDFPEGVVRIRVQSEMGKVDLNAAQHDLLRGLFAVHVDDEVADALAGAVTDWRDEDKLKSTNGAEDRDYRAEGYPYGAADASFQSIEELQQVMGMTPELYQQVSGGLTVHSRRRTIDPATATREALLALPGIAEEQVDEFLATRSVEEGGESFLPLELLAGAERYLASVQATVYTVAAEAQLPGGAVSVREAVVRVTRDSKQPFRILRWRVGVPGRMSPPADPPPEEDRERG